MILQTIVLLIGVVGASYVLACASWQIVLSSFMCAGFGYALWQTRRALIRRSKIRELWHRSVELEPFLNELDEEPAYQLFVNQDPQLEEKREEKPVIKVAPLREACAGAVVSRFPIQKISSL